jgi:hypothetical protein
MMKSGALALRFSLLATVISLSSMVNLRAQTLKGSFEIGIEAGGFFFISNSGHETVGGFGLSGEPHVDYFISDQVEVGATGFYYHPIDGDPSLPSIFFGGAYGHVNYHFNSGSTISSYVGGRIGVVKPNIETSFAVGAQAGLQYFVAPAFSINGQLDVTTSKGFGLLSCLGFGFSYYVK